MCNSNDALGVEHKRSSTYINSSLFAINKPRCWKQPGHYLCTPEPGILGCVISTQKGVKSDAYPVAVSQKVTKNLLFFFYSPTPGFKPNFKENTTNTLSLYLSTFNLFVDD